MGMFVFFPFGKFLVSDYYVGEGEDQILLADSERIGRKKPPPILSTVFWYFFSFLFLLPIHVLSFMITWVLIFFIPMSKVNKEIIKILVYRPLDVGILNDFPEFSCHVKLCTFSAVNMFYYKYSVFGMNVILFNMLPFVIFSISEEYLFPKEYQFSSLTMFILDIIGTVPLAYYIKMSISSLSAQSNYLVGAILNATFGSSIKIILYLTTIFASKGALNELVRYSYIGSVLGDLLLLPGLAMTFGGIKHKIQKLNNEGAGVSSVLLMISLSGAFVPSLIYQVYGNYGIDCSGCVSSQNETLNVFCRSCTSVPIDPLKDDIYIDYIRPLTFIIACILPISYIVGLVFTLFTHSHIYDEFEDENDVSEQPVWNKPVAFLILLFATGLFTLITRNLVTEIEIIVENTRISQDFVGLTVISIVPSIAQYINAISFALNDNLSLSFEIGESSAIQTALISIPVVVITTSYLELEYQFALVFPTLCMFSIIIAIIILSIITVDGKSNYFIGISLTVIYIILITAFFYTPKIPPKMMHIDL